MEVKKMDEIKKDFLCKNIKMVRQGACDHNDKVKAYCRELISLMPWLGPHIVNHNDQGSTLQVIKYVMPTIIIKGRDSLDNIMND